MNNLLIFGMLSCMENNQIVSMLKELREVAEMSPLERNLYALVNPDAMVFGLVDKNSIIATREEILMNLN
jgi:hypothetical protein